MIHACINQVPPILPRGYVCAVEACIMQRVKRGPDWYSTCLDDTDGNGDRGAATILGFRTVDGVEEGCMSDYYCKGMQACVQWDHSGMISVHEIGEGGKFQLCLDRSAPPPVKMRSKEHGGRRQYAHALEDDSKVKSMYLSDEEDLHMHPGYINDAYDTVSFLPSTNGVGINVKAEAAYAIARGAVVAEEAQLTEAPVDATSSPLYQFLKNIDVHSRVWPIFKREQVSDFEVLEALEKQDLRDIGVSMGDAVRILKALQNIKMLQGGNPQTVDSFEGTPCNKLDSGINFLSHSDVDEDFSDFSDYEDNLDC